MFISQKVSKRKLLRKNFDLTSRRERFILSNMRNFVFCLKIVAGVVFGFFANLLIAEMPIPDSLKSEAHNRDSYGWRERHEAVLKRNQTVKPAYVFFGDSITHWWGGEPSTKFAATGGDSWKCLFRDHAVTNMGFGFDYIDNAYYRAENGALDGISPRVILVNLGTNNIGHRGDSAEICGRNMRAFVALLRKKQPNAKILLIGVYPRREARLAKIIAETNERYALLADGETVFFVNPGTRLLATDGKLADPRFMRDVVHLKPEGYRIIGAELEKALMQIDPAYTGTRDGK